MTALRGHQRVASGVVLVLALLLMAGASGPVAASQVGAPRAQPELIELAAREPGRMIQVIVQMTGERDTVDAQLARLGAKVTRDLHIINAVTAELQAGEAVELARSAGIKWISLDSPVYKTAGPDAAFDTGNLVSSYVSAIGADRLWAEGYQGSGVTVAVVDSGMANTTDLGSRILARVKLNSNTAAASDQYGHGSHIAGIVGSNGAGSGGQYVGVAPKVNLVSVKVTDDQGAGSTSDLVAGLQWVLDNKDLYSIKVVNISLNSSTAQSYNVDPLDAASEILWFNKIVVVVSAGNSGNGVLNPPANDPFVITVGAVDDRGTRSVGDDALAVYSAYGVTESGYNKPDVVAPGSNIVSTLASNGETLAKAHPANVVPGGYFRMSGTSMASGVTAGAAALLLQANPGLTPDQVKYRLRATGRPLSAGNAAPYLDVYAAVHGASTDAANIGVPVSQLLNTGSSPAGMLWGSVNWSSVNWSSVNWSSVNWSSVNWSSVNWSSVNWSSDYWGN